MLGGAETGFDGLSWRSSTNTLIVADPSANQIVELTPTGRTVLRQPADGARGLTLNPQGLLVAAERDARRLTLMRSA